MRRIREIMISIGNTSDGEVADRSTGSALGSVARVGVDAGMWVIRWALWLLVSWWIFSGWPATGSAGEPLRLDAPLRPRVQRHVRTGIARLELFLLDASARAR
jgi:hypothetical protein